MDSCLRRWHQELPSTFEGLSRGRGGGGGSERRSADSRPNPPCQAGAPIAAYPITPSYSSHRERWSLWAFAHTLPLHLEHPSTFLQYLLILSIQSCMFPVLGPFCQHPAPAWARSLLWALTVSGARLCLSQGCGHVAMTRLD